MALIDLRKVEKPKKYGIDWKTAMKTELVGITDEQRKFILDYTNTIYYEAVNDAKEFYPERFAKLTEEDLNLFKLSKLGEAEKLASDILDKTTLYKQFRVGRFHTCNKASRNLFEGLTGIKLPKTNRETDIVIIDYIGKDYVEEQRENARKESQRLLEQEKNKQESKQKERIDGIKQRVKGNVPIGGDELADVAIDLGIYVAPATVGMLRRKISSISNGTATVNKNLAISSSQTAHRIYKQVLSKMGCSCPSVACPLHGLPAGSGSAGY